MSEDGLLFSMNRGGRARLSQRAVNMKLLRLRGAPGQTRPSLVLQVGPVVSTRRGVDLVRIHGAVRTRRLTHLVGFSGAMRDQRVPGFLSPTLTSRGGEGEKPEALVLLPPEPFPP
jgi:hypothetical protein